MADGDSIRYQVWRKYQMFSDIIVHYTIARWMFSILVTATYIYRAWLFNGLHLISYFVGLHILELFIGFISPKDTEEIEAGMPTRESDEFRPFRRAIKEFDFWYANNTGGSLPLAFW